MRIKKNPRGVTPRGLSIALLLFFFALLLATTPSGSASNPRPYPTYAATFRSFEVSDPTASPRAYGTTPAGEMDDTTRVSPTASPTARPTQKPKPKSTPRPITRTRTGSIRGWLTGTATWYCEAGRSRCPTRYPDRAGIADLYAAAGPALRRAFDGKWRGRHVLVCKGKTCVEVKLVDWCACGHGRVIDLFGDAFKQLAPLSRGEIRVAVDIP